MSNYFEQDAIKACLQKVENKLGWGSSAQWNNEVFAELSQTIQEATGVLLSPTTLKRVWGKVKYSNAPSISTLNALSQFAGYSNWRELKNKLDITTTDKPRFKYSLQNSRMMISGAVIACVVRS